MADPTVIDCASACTVTVVHELVFPPFQLTLAEGAQIAAAIAVIWAIAWGFRVLIRMLGSSSDGVTSTNED